MDGRADDAPEAGARTEDAGAAPSLYDLVERFAEDAFSRVRGETGRASGKAAGALTAVLQELGVVLRRDHEELELRVAQLEHRLALLERRADDGGGDAPDAPAD